MVYTLDEIRSRVAPIAQKYHVSALYLFGSYARGTAHEDSDLDILVDTNGTPLKSLLSLGAFQNELSEALSKRVDLVSLSALTQSAQMPSDDDFRDAVLKEKVCLYAFT